MESEIARHAAEAEEKASAAAAHALVARKSLESIETGKFSVELASGGEGSADGKVIAAYLLAHPQTPPRLTTPRLFLRTLARLP